ncbi:DEAD/DEAH box helicase family protein [Soonwooa sp.]|uniref:DEAD/DEAH box helicase family protein n=1 Tax=Soonwooa sp. TaxID=1938592 RepID=UPI0028B2434B|nr:DEAD/DEAH box helicase family protein [Soonwooa sp.]
MENLNTLISSGISLGFIKLEANPNIVNNLNPKWGLRPYQIEAFARFNYYLTSYPQKQIPSQLLFHMATGSGKTLVMAGIILDLYQRGYRNFIFFVNSTSIIEKTKDNFLNNLSSKYLFNDTISFSDKRVEIVEVENFEAVNSEDINIVFTTVQGLHTRLNAPRENSITYEDFEDKKVVLLSDEAHHINADTKKGKLSKDEAEEIISWESTVNKIFKSNSDNLLLEFTATADLDNANVKEKYEDKLIFDYPLKQFRIDKYSKEVQLLQADLEPFERTLQAVLLSQYRRKIFQDFKKNIKPVILLKSKTIGESVTFYDEFIEKIKTLSEKDILNIKAKNDKGIFKKIFNYFDENKVSIENLLIELKEDFGGDKCISVNSKNDTDEKQLIINSLEDKSNEYRVVFAVDKLNEGWDVLNLFDIVRLYNTRDSDHKAGKIGKTTMSEAQLIGRGARYCPFQLDESQSLFQRKYDDDLDFPLRICEELYYHSAHNPKYISELNKALEEIGLKAPKVVQRVLKLKDSFIESDFYKSGFIFTNERKPYDRSDVTELSPAIRNKIVKSVFSTGYSSSSKIFEENTTVALKRETKIWNILDFGEPVIRKAINKLPFYRFDNLQSKFPNLTSISEFINSESYLKDIKVEIEGDEIVALNPDKEVQLKSVIKVLEEISKYISNGFIEFKGTYEFKSQNVSYVFKEKTISYSVNESSDKETGIPQTETTNLDLLIDLSKEDWYAFNDNYGSSEEKYLVKFIKQAYSSLKNKYEDIYLLRNENHFKLYNFDDGQVFEPDFVLFMKEKDNAKPIIFQAFIEPKGSQLIDKDKWKQDFLVEIEKQGKILEIFSNRKYRLIGLPFYNEETLKHNFDTLFINKFGIN